MLFSQLCIIYIKKGIFWWETFHSFRISLITLSFLQCLSYFLECSISFICFIHSFYPSFNSFVSVSFWGGGVGHPFFGGDAMGLSLSILVDIPFNIKNFSLY